MTLSPSHIRSRVSTLSLTLAAVLTTSLLAPALAAAVEINEEFKPQEEFKLEPWIPLQIGGIDMSINKAVFLLMLSGFLTCFTMLYMSHKLKAKPGKVQALFEMAYDVAYNQITRDNIEKEKYAQRWFPFLIALFFFILFNNFIGFIPLPLDSKHELTVPGINIEVNALAIYAATANISVPLVLTLVVWVSYNWEGVRNKGMFDYLAGFVPGSVPTLLKPAMFFLEILSHLVRIVSLSARLFANMLAGHLLILLMGGGMAILLGSAIVGVVTAPIAIAFYIFEVVIVAGLQAFIFAILSGIYIGEAVADGGH
ncbi:MAG: F0F1 ATP synthase subunit A [Solirubrobacterales bacterium]